MVSYLVRIFNLGPGEHWKAGACWLGDREEGSETAGAETQPSGPSWSHGQDQESKETVKHQTIKKWRAVARLMAQTLAEFEDLGFTDTF